ncbi:type 1 glutamine amidotransferase domain-containing protein [Roseomonas marmotae]|uniref:Type 1 glutamine amidotransferase n=1 Tax=Roseomonas marmotae TaxID=2768161 RepID=A0ABS3KBN1_9PROT|nr:type 1 glutamine amidotransferase domain-containing protein [Roseomonas marmotae]MBO1074854.1 type 1 glutamine amidotransferase [Roseomonas marmotae]QTI80641.1 type 1 glutamine amidotransferase [Roseomonas marmotae]
MTDIRQARILVLATDGFEQSELLVPVEQLRAKGATVEVAAPEKTMEPGHITGWDGAAERPGWGRKVKVDRKLAEVSAQDYDAIVLPGGQINPDKLRMEPQAVALVQDFAAKGKVVAAICHGPWLLAEAGLAKGRKLTSFASIKTDMKNAGATWVDQEVVTDKGIVTSRSPKDLDAFVAKIVEEVGEGNHGDRRAA